MWQKLSSKVIFKHPRLTLLGTYFPDSRRSNQTMTVFLGTNLEAKTLSGDIEEDIQSSWLTKAEIDHLIATGALTNGSALAAWSLFRASPHHVS
jgi:hypothetical protein